MAFSAFVVLLAVVSACLCAPQGLGGEEGDLSSLAGELRDVAGRLFDVSASLARSEPVPDADQQRDAVEAFPTEATSGTSPLEPSAQSTPTPTLSTIPEGLPDNDAYRRRLFFIGDLGEEYVRVPSRTLLPPDVAQQDAAVAAPLPDKASLFKVSEQAVVDHRFAAPLAGLHEKDLAPRPGTRFRVEQRAATRDQEIRAAMEGDVFQGPLPVAGVRQGRSMDMKEVMMFAGEPGRVYRWSIFSDEQDPIQQGRPEGHA